MLSRNILKCLLYYIFLQRNEVRAYNSLYLLINYFC